MFYRIGPQQLGAADCERLCGAVNGHGVGVVAIGNGTACRETEGLVAELIKGEICNYNASRADGVTGGTESGKEVTLNSKNLNAT